MGLAEGNLDVALPGHFCAVGDAGADVGLLDPGIILQKLFDRRARSQEMLGWSRREATQSPGRGARSLPTSRREEARAAGA